MSATMPTADRLGAGPRAICSRDNATPRRADNHYPARLPPAQFVLLAASLVGGSEAIDPLGDRPLALPQLSPVPTD